MKHRVLLATALASGSFAASELIAGASRLPDGPDVVAGPLVPVSADRVMVGGEVIELAGVDAPFGTGSSRNSALSSLVGDSKVYCSTHRARVEGTVPVGECFVGGVNIGRWLVGNGFATAEAALNSPYRVSQVRARLQRKGIWADKA